jgi:hypothetical protein
MLYYLYCFYCKHLIFCFIMVSFLLHIFCDFVVEFNERTFLDDSWVPLSPGLDLVNDEQPLLFRRMRTRCLSWIVARVRAPMVFHHWFWKMVHCFHAKLSIVTHIFKSGRLNDILRYCRLLPSCLNCWFTGSCTRILRAVFWTANMALLRVVQLYLICSNIPLSFWSQLRMVARWIRSTRIFQKTFFQN